MRYAVRDTDASVEAEITARHGGSEYTVRINGTERKLRVLEMTSGGIEFVLDQKYHHARYLDVSTSEMGMVIDNVPVTLGMHEHLDDIVYKNSGGGGPAGAQTELKSQIPGKVVSVAVAEGDTVKKGDVVCTLESMKMQVAVKAHRDGKAGSIRVKEGDTVAKGDLITEIT